MINSDDLAEPDPKTVDEIVEAGPHGAVAVASVATFIVVMMWVLFYLLVFVPRGA